MKLEKEYEEKIKKNNYTLESFLEEFSNEDEYTKTKEELKEDIHFYIDEYLGYNDFEEPETVADDDIEYEMVGW